MDTFFLFAEELEQALQVQDSRRQLTPLWDAGELAIHLGEQLLTYRESIQKYGMESQTLELINPHNWMDLPDAPTYDPRVITGAQEKLLDGIKAVFEAIWKFFVRIGQWFKQQWQIITSRRHRTAYGISKLPEVVEKLAKRLERKNPQLLTQFDFGKCSEYASQSYPIIAANNYGAYWESSLHCKQLLVKSSQALFSLQNTKLTPEETDRRFKELFELRENLTQASVDTLTQSTHSHLTSNAKFPMFEVQTPEHGGWTRDHWARAVLETGKFYIETDKIQHELMDIMIKLSKHNEELAKRMMTMADHEGEDLRAELEHCKQQQRVSKAIMAASSEIDDRDKLVDHMLGQMFHDLDAIFKILIKK